MYNNIKLFSVYKVIFQHSLKIIKCIFYKIDLEMSVIIPRNPQNVCYENEINIFFITVLTISIKKVTFLNLFETINTDNFVPVK